MGFHAEQHAGDYDAGDERDDYPLQAYDPPLHADGECRWCSWRPGYSEGHSPWCPDHPWRDGTMRESPVRGFAWAFAVGLVLVGVLALTWWLV